MIYKKQFLFFLMLCVIFSCRPEEDDSIDIGSLPEKPTFEMEFVNGNPNQVIINSTATGFFDYVWDLPGATPNKSQLERDTVFYPNAGSYAITLHASKEGGSGTSSLTKTVTIENDAVILCDPLVSDLTGECTSKCWKLSETDGSVIVGPQPFSAEWFSSTGLEDSQINDRWCFTFDGGGHEYMNGGDTFSACQGFVTDTNYPVPVGATFQILPSSSANSEFKIILPDDSWMGVEDTGPEYEIISITEDELVLLTAINTCDGTPSPGWFTLTFEQE